MSAKRYIISFDLVCSHEITVSARSSGEAIDKAIKRLAKRLHRRKYWSIGWMDENGRAGGREGKGY